MPEGVIGSWGPDVGRYAKARLGLVLDRWQQRAMNRALAYGEDGRLVHGLYLVSAARQNGKTVKARSLIGWALTALETPDWRRILGLAFDKGQARIPYEAVMQDLAPIAREVGRSNLAVTRYLGIRSDLYGRHREYHVGSRDAADQVRSQSNDLGVFDEVRTQRDHRVWAALEPTTTARPDPLIFATSTAGDDRSVLLREWWERGIRIIDGAEPMGRFGMTWYAAPDGLAPDDPRAIRAANPAIAEGRLSMAAVLESLHTLGPAAYRSERLNLWSDSADLWLPPGVWARTVGLQPAMAGRAILGVEVTPSWRRATIVVALPTDDGAWIGVALELDQVRGGSVDPNALAAALSSVAATWRPQAVAYNVAAAAAPYVEAWAQGADVATVALGAREIRAASELFRAELVGGRLTHADDPLLAHQARQARPSLAIEGGGWYLSVKESVGDIDGIRAGAWAAWATIAPENPYPAVQLFV